MRASVTAVSIYGGYFGTGIGVLFVAVRGLFVKDSLRRLNATKTLLQFLANGIAGVLFAFTAPVHWSAAVTLGVSSSLGAPVGGRLARFIPANRLRQIICIIGVAASCYLLAKQL